MERSITGWHTRYSFQRLDGRNFWISPLLLLKLSKGFKKPRIPSIQFSTSLESTKLDSLRRVKHLATRAGRLKSCMLLSSTAMSKRSSQSLEGNGQFLPSLPSTDRLTTTVECMRWHLRNHNCKQILLGISHDAGYAPFLDEVAATEEERSRVTIIEGPPIVRELSATNIQIMPLNNIFRTDKLIDRLEIMNDRVTSPAATNGAPTWAKLTSIPPVPGAAPVVVVKNCTNGVKKATPTLKTAKPTWIPGPHGLDPQLSVNAAVLERVKRRTNKDKLCNNHYLRGPCAKGE